MGTRYEDQPVEQWAGPESLDPTPVWKQYILVALLLFVGLVVVVVFSLMALAPNFVTPPALVPGDRLVLSAKEIPDGALRVGSPLLEESRAIYVVRLVPPGVMYALATQWSPRAGDVSCPVTIDGSARPPSFVADCGPVRGKFHFGASGNAPETSKGPVSRDLDHYLVSVSGDRVIVNLSRLIESSQRTGGPVPTGIPQPQTQQP
jgi:hypothetical protein